MSRADQLCNDLDEQIEKFRKESDKHKNLFRKLRYLLFGLTALSTVLASIALGFDEWKRAVSLVVVMANALAAVITSIEGLRKPGDLWVLERRVLYALIDLNREVEYVGKTSLTEKQADDFFSRMQAILSSSLESWTPQVKPKALPS